MNDKASSFGGVATRRAHNTTMAACYVAGCDDTKAHAPVKRLWHPGDVPGGSATAPTKTPPCAALGAKNAKRRCRHNAAPNVGERGRTAPNRATPEGPKCRAWWHFRRHCRPPLSFYCVLGIPGRIRLLFSTLWASQGEFVCYLRHSGHPKANSFAICGALDVLGRARSLHAAFQSHVFRRCLTGAALRYCHCGGVGEATWI